MPSMAASSTSQRSSRARGRPRLGCDGEIRCGPVTYGATPFAVATRDLDVRVIAGREEFRVADASKGRDVFDCWTDVGRHHPVAPRNPLERRRFDGHAGVVDATTGPVGVGSSLDLAGPAPQSKGSS